MEDFGCLGVHAWDFPLRSGEIYSWHGSSHLSPLPSPLPPASQQQWRSLGFLLIMEGLLHWDFAPGLALSDQVRRKYGSMIHFSPSRDTKEFFFVVTFSSASFPLTVDSVGVALQCCIGGFCDGFKVV